MSTVEVQKRPARSPREAAAALMRLNESLRNKLLAADQEIAELRDALEKAQEEQGELKEDMVLASMHLAGLEAELEAFQEEASYCGLLDKTSERFDDGTYKTRGRLVYEKAFDEEGLNSGIANPASYRPS